MSELYDYIIVGAGSAGCVLARELASNNTHYRILLLEAGSNDSPEIITNPLNFKTLLQSQDLDCKWRYSSDPENYKIQGGKGIGGTSSINACIYLRGHPKDYESWVGGSKSLWSAERMKQCFEEFETNYLKWNHSTIHKSAKSTPEESSDVIQSVISTCKKYYTYDNELRLGNNTHLTGLAFHPYTINSSTNTRLSANILCLTDPSPNLDILTRVQVERLILSNDDDVKQQKVVGVLLNDNRKLFVNKEVILCAGTFGSAQILLRSGINPKNSIGKCIDDHYGFQLKYQTKSTFNATVPASFMYLFGRLKHNSNNNVDHDQQPDWAIGFKTDNNILTLTCWLCHPESKSQLSFTSNNNIHVKHSITKNDQDKYLELFYIARNIVNNMNEQDQLDLKEIEPGLSVQQPNHVIQYLLEKYLSFDHFTSSCPIGTVVDETLKVYGIDSLRVADASVMPCVPSCNTNGSVYALAMNAARIISKQK